MIVSEMLEELRESILRDTTDALSADEADLLWSDRALLRYLNDGYFRFCERSRILEDATTPEVCEILLAAGQRSYPLHKSILHVASAVYGKKALKLAGVAAAHNHPDEVSGLTASLTADYPGVTAFSPDYNVGVFRVVGSPTEADDGKVVNLRVNRLPLEPINEENIELEPEVPSQYHLDIIEWAAFRALRNHDPDGEFMAKASAHSTRFERAVEEARETHRRRTFTGIQFAPSWSW